MEVVEAEEVQAAYRLVSTSYASAAHFRFSLSRVFRDTDSALYWAFLKISDDSVSTLSSSSTIPASILSHNVRNSVSYLVRYRRVASKASAFAPGSTIRSRSATMEMTIPETAATVSLWGRRFRSEVNTPTPETARRIRDAYLAWLYRLPKTSKYLETLDISSRSCQTLFRTLMETMGLPLRPSYRNSMGPYSPCQDDFLADNVHHAHRCCRQVASPRVHQPATALEQVASEVGPLDTRNLVSQRRFGGAVVSDCILAKQQKSRYTSPYGTSGTGS